MTYRTRGRIVEEYAQAKKLSSLSLRCTGERGELLVVARDIVQRTLPHEPRISMFLVWEMSCKTNISCDYRNMHIINITFPYISNDGSGPCSVQLITIIIVKCAAFHGRMNIGGVRVPSSA